MKEEIKNKWVAALRSGEYKQGNGRLRDSANGFCCLGVLCDLYSKEKEVPWTFVNVRFPYFLNENAILPSEVAKWAGTRVKDGSYGDGETYGLIYYNDTLNYDFNKIADIIEKDWQLI